MQFRLYSVSKTLACDINGLIIASSGIHITSTLVKSSFDNLFIILPFKSYNAFLNTFSMQVLLEKGFWPQVIWTLMIYCAKTGEGIFKWTVQKDLGK